jgi:hypothetical protein
MAVAELMRILLDEAHLGWDQAWDSENARLHQPHTASRGPRKMAGRVVWHRGAPLHGDHLRDQSALPR